MSLTPTQQLLLAFLGTAEREIDPIRLVKGLFLVSREAPTDWLPAGAEYKFVPYHYGPYSFELNGDLGALQRSGLVQARDVPGRSWSYYSLTRGGRARATGLDLDARLLVYARQVREFVDGLSMRQLLASIYRRYPDYAVRSVFKF